MNREYRLGFCKECTHRAFDMQHGIVCKLTHKPADFSSSCPNYELDEQAREKNRQQQEASAQVELEEETLGLQFLGIKTKSGAGCLIMGLSGIATITTIIFLGVISFWLIFLFILGCIVLVIGLIQARDKKAANRRRDNVLDELD